MKKSKKWRMWLLASLLTLTVVGCEQKTDNKPNTQETPAVTVSQTQSQTQGASIYNTAFESYNNITELGLIVNQPTEEDFSRLSTLESYGDFDEQPMLLIPKYTGCKVTVSAAEYTGERYIAKEVVFTNENTPEGYGLRLNLARPDGIPQYIVTINYKNKTYDYVIASNGKDGNTGVEYIQVESDKSKKQEGDLILPTQDPGYLKDLHLLSDCEIDVDKDGEMEKVEVYSDAPIDSKGDVLLDDNHTWTLVLRKGKEIYPLFDKNQIQLGTLNYTVYEDYSNYEKLHIMIAYKASAGIFYYDCTYDEATGNMLRKEVYGSNNINLIQDWR